MHSTVFLLLFIAVYKGSYVYGSTCGCKQLRPCYEKMLLELRAGSEESCIEDAAIGTSTYVIYIHALQKYCGNIVNFTALNMTSEKRYLYEVTVYSGNQTGNETPIILIDAGQKAGQKSVMFALYIIEQLVACEENHEMTKHLKWIILPCTNPDGLEYSRHNRPRWTKNTRIDKESSSIGVDISRNFEHYWHNCDKVHSMGTLYAGPNFDSEIETQFVKSVIDKNAKKINAYVSIKRDGHGFLYPYAYGPTEPQHIEIIKKVASLVTAKVNPKAGTVHAFVNESIYNETGKGYCGNSIDYAFDSRVYLSFEMRVFMDWETTIVSKFQSYPKGFEASLRTGYWNGIKELYRIVSDPVKYNIKFGPESRFRN